MNWAVMGYYGLSLEHFGVVWAVLLGVELSGICVLDTVWLRVFGRKWKIMLKRTKDRHGIEGGYWGSPLVTFSLDRYYFSPKL